MSAFAYERDAENGTNTWLTPRWILDRLGAFNLDPCAHPNWPIAREHYVWPEQDGLMLPWNGRVWCNPPYGSETDAWVERMAVHRNGVMLIFARTDTQRFRRIWEVADRMMFIYGRVAFLREDLTPSDGGNAPSVLVAFGNENATALSRSGLSGALVTEWRA